MDGPFTINDEFSEFGTSITLLASAKTTTAVDISGIDFSAYKFIFLTLSGDADVNLNYVNNIILSSFIPNTVCQMITRVFSLNGTFLGNGTAHFKTKTLSITNTTYPAYLYGIN